MNNIDDITYEQLTSLIEKLVENKVNEILNNYGVESTSFGTIVSLDSLRGSDVLRASVELPDGNIISNLFNASREVLSVGDKVKIFGSRTNMSNRYIGMKYESEVRF